MLKSILFFISFFAASAFIFISGCSNDNTTNIPVVTTTGVFVLNEGQYNVVTTSDYSFIDLSKGSVQTNVYQNSNGGATMNLVPDGMLLYNNTTLYIATQGNYGGQGTVFEINATNNKKIASRSFGTNPYDIIWINNKLYVTNTAGSYVSIMDMNLNSIKDSLQVGPNPADMIHYLSYVYVAKQSYTSENSLAIINSSYDTAGRVFFPAPPVGVSANYNGVYVSTYTNKKIYVMDTLVPTRINDSIAIQITEPAIGTIIAGPTGYLFIVAISNTTSGAQTGVYKLNLYTKSLDATFSIQTSGLNDVYGIAYDFTGQKLYIGNSMGGAVLGSVLVYSTSGSLLNTYNNVGYFPKRFAFK